MGWKSINKFSVAPRKLKNENLNPLGIGRKDLHPDDEKALRDIHSGVLDAEETFLQSHRSLAEEVYRIGYSQSSRLLGVTDQALRKLVKTAFAGLRTSLPRFDWKENCQSCARPLKQSPEELKSVGKRVPSKSTGGHWDREPLSQEDIDSLLEKNDTLKIAEVAFLKSRKDFAKFIKTIGIAPTSRVFDVSRNSLTQWVGAMLKQDKNRAKNSSISIYGPDDQGNCRACSRPITVGEN